MNISSHEDPASKGWDCTYLECDWGLQVKSLAGVGEWQSRGSSLGPADLEARSLLKDKSPDATLPFRQQEHPHKGTSCSGLQGHFLPSALWTGRASEDKVQRLWEGLADWPGVALGLGFYGHAENVARIFCG